MRVVVNGEERDIQPGSSVSELVSALGFGTRQVVVELNREALGRARYPDTTLQEGDVIEIVRAVAGG